jgi:hypothetical protein
MSHIFGNVRKFSGQHVDLHAAMAEYSRNILLQRSGVKAFASTSQNDMEKLINKEFALVVQSKAGVQFPDANDASAMREMADHPLVKYFANAIRNTLVDMVLPDVLLTGSLGYFAEFRFAELGDTLKIDIENNALYHVTKAGERGKHTNMQKLFRNTETLYGVNHMITTGTDLYEVLINFHFIAKDVMKAALSVESQMLYEAYDVFNSAMDDLSGNLSVTNYSEPALVKLAQTVTAYNSNKKAIILGTPVALKSVLPSNPNFRFLLNDEYVVNGALQTFNGYDVVPMSQVADYLNPVPYSLKLDDKRIYVVSPAAQKLVTIGVFGGTMSAADSPQTNQNKLMMNTMEKHWNTIVATNSAAGIVTNLG